MPFAFKSRVMKVGNSLVLVLPKPLCEGFGIEKGSILSVTARDNGIYIPMSEGEAELRRSGIQPAVTYPDRPSKPSTETTNKTKSKSIAKIQT